MRALAAICRDVDRGAVIRGEQARLKTELDAIEERLEADALARPDLHEPLADAAREGRQFIAHGTALALPIVFTSDMLIKSFAPKSAVHLRVLTASRESFPKFYLPKTVYEITQKDGKQFRALAAEILGAKAPPLIAACRVVDKDGIPRCATKIEWDAALADLGATKAAA